MKNFLQKHTKKKAKRITKKRKRKTGVQKKECVKRARKVSSQWFSSDFNSGEKNLIKSSLKKRNEDENERLGGICGVTIIRKNFWTLRPKEWLDDCIVNGLFNQLKMRDVEINDCNKNYFVISLWYTKLLCGCTYYYENVQNWLHSSSQDTNIFSFEKMFIPSNINNQHWTLVVVDFQAKSIQIIDSIVGGKGHLDISNYIFQFIKDEWNFNQNST